MFHLGVYLIKHIHVNVLDFNQSFHIQLLQLSLGFGFLSPRVMLEHRVHVDLRALLELVENLVTLDPLAQLDLL